MNFKAIVYNLILLVINIFIINSAYSETKVSHPMAIVDVQIILERSLAAQSIRTRIETISKTIQEGINHKTNELKKIEEELNSKRQYVGETIDEEAFTKELLEFNKKVSTLQREAKENKNKLEQAHSEAISKVHEAILGIIHNLAKEKGFEVVVPNSLVIYSNPALHITDYIVEELNASLKEVQINYR